MIRRLIALALVAFLFAPASVFGAGIPEDGKGVNQADLVAALYRIQNAMNNTCMTNSGLAVGTPASSVAIVATVTYTVGGQFYQASATPQIPFSTGHQALGNSKQCIFLVCLSSSGAWSTIQGPVLPTYEAEKYPKLTEDQTPVGAVKIVTSSVGSFTPRVNLLSASGVTATYRSLARRPLSLSGL